MTKMFLEHHILRCFQSAGLGLRSCLQITAQKAAAKYQDVTHVTYVTHICTHVKSPHPSPRAASLLAPLSG